MAAKIIDQELAGRKISIRPEVELSRPFGLASWRTRAGLRKIAVRKIVAKTEGLGANPRSQALSPASQVQRRSGAGPVPGICR